MADGHWNSQLRIAAGYAVDDAPQLAFAERGDGQGRIVSLYILAEPVAAGSEAFIDSFVARIGELFDPAARSLTGALKLAMETAHEELRVWNREHVAAEQAAYGVSCLMLREDGAGILGQAGPSLAFTAGDPGEAGSRLTQLHAHRGDDPVAAPIGGSRQLTVQFASAPRARAGWALLLTTNVGQLLDAQRRVALSRLPADEVLRNLYPSLTPLYDAAGLIVALADENIIPPPPSPPLPAPPPPLAPQPPAGPPLSGAGLPAGAEALVGDRDVDAPAAAPQPPPDSEEPPANRPANPPGDPSLRRGLEFRRELSVPSFSLGPELSGSAMAWPRNPFATQEMQVLSVAVGPSGPPVQRSIMDVGHTLPSLGGEPAPTPSSPVIARRGEPRGSPNRRMALALVGMVLVFAAVAAALLGPALLRTEQDEYTALLEQARTDLAASKLAVGAEAARPALDDALERVSAALELNPLAEEALALRSEIEAALDLLKLVQSPGELLTLVDLGRYGPTIALGTMRVAGERVFALDDAGGRVFAVASDGVATVIYEEGSVLSPSGQMLAGRPISISAEAPGGETALWILDAEAQLYRWTESGTLLIPIPGLSRFGSADAIAVGAGGLYVLDTAGGAVWRLAYDGRSLAEPVRAFARTDLHQANELVISSTDRGGVEILVAGADGRLRRFVHGEEEAIPLTLERELLVPASLTVGAESGLVYMADRGGGRVLVLRPEVGLVSQIESAELRELRGVAVDEASGRIVYALPSSLLLGQLQGSGQ